MKAFTVFAAIVGTVAAKRDGYAYVDDWNCKSSTCFVPYAKKMVTTGLNNVVLAFCMPQGSVESPSWYADSTEAYYKLTDAERTDLLGHYAANDAKLWMSIGGGTYYIGYLNEDPATVARLACQRAKDHGYYGVDFDLEYVDQGNWDRFYPWAMAASQACSPIMDGHIAHAPQVPYFGAWLNFGYEKLVPYSQHFLTQFYNQRPSQPYTDEAGLWAASTDGAKEGWTDIIQRHQLLSQMVVIGKIIRPQDGGIGYLTAAEFDALLKIGEQKYGYSNGYMIWKVPMAEEAASFDNFINHDIPLLAAVGSGGGSHTTTTTTRPVVITTQPNVVNPPPQPTPAPTLPPPTTTTRPNVEGSSIISHCQSLVAWPENSDWQEHCKSMCEYYGSNPAFCSGAATGEGLAACVLQNFSTSCRHA